MAIQKEVTVKVQSSNHACANSLSKYAYLGNALKRKNACLRIIMQNYTYLYANLGIIVQRGIAVHYFAIDAKFAYFISVLFEGI